MSEPYLSEIEARLDAFRYRINELEKGVRMLNQQLARAWQQGGGGGGGSDPHYFLAYSDGAAAASGTFPSITPGSFSSDVKDLTTGDVIAGATVYWWATDALTTAGALVLCLKNPDGSYLGVVEQCSAVDEDA